MNRIFLIASVIDQFLIFVSAMDLESLSECEVFLDEPISDEAGRGCYGAVYKSKLNGAVVVVKKVHDIFTGSGGNDPVSDAEWKGAVGKFIHEIRLLSSQRHPNIVQFLGVHGLFGDPRGIGLVMENMDMDLRRFMDTNKSNMPLGVKLSILKDTANGVTHLHSKNVVHRDLNAGNVLLTSSLQAKVADLGVSRIVSDQQYQQGLTVGPGTLDYMPPEALAKDPNYGPKLDCFSFGHLSLYLVNEEYPRVFEFTVENYPDKQGEFQITKRSVWLKMLGNQHPLYYLIRTCLHDDPKQRWEMKKIGNELENLMLQHQHRMPKFIELITKQQEYETKKLPQESSKPELEGIRAMEQQNAHLSQQVHSFREALETSQRLTCQLEECIKTSLEANVDIIEDQRGQITFSVVDGRSASGTKSAAGSDTTPKTTSPPNKKTTVLTKQKSYSNDTCTPAGKDGVKDDSQIPSQVPVKPKLGDSTFGSDTTPKTTFPFNTKTAAQPKQKSYQNDASIPAGKKLVDKTDTNRTSKPGGITNSSSTLPRSRSRSTSGRPSSGLYDVNPLVESKGPHQADRRTSKERFLMVKTPSAVEDRSQRMLELAELISQRNQAIEEADNN